MHYSEVLFIACVCKALGHMFKRFDYYRDQAHRDHNSVMSDWHYRAHRFDFHLELWKIFMCSFNYGQETMLAYRDLKFRSWIGTSSEITVQAVRARKRKLNDDFTGIQGNDLKFTARRSSRIIFLLIQK